MLPLYPPYPINDLAHEHLEGRLPDGRPRHRHDPDRFLDESSALQPNPVFMGLRQVLFSSPIGRLMRWIDRKAEEREDRGSGSRLDTMGGSVAPAPLPDAEGDDDSGRRTAA